jgi:uncharacterized protein YbbC (DUF1343 family)
MSAAIEFGLERCVQHTPRPLAGGARFGLLMNQASVDRRFRYSCDLLAASFPGQLAAIFSPQHGLWGEEQANMIESGHTRYIVEPSTGRSAPLDVPVHSLYSETRQPTEAMLRGIDCLVIDLQDVGTRVYTFAWTIQNCLKACAKANIPVVLLDRPNPLGGRVAEGPLLSPGYESFVGGASIPLRHGLTLGELARLMNIEQQLGASLEVVTMTAWRRDILFSETGRAWVAPSPNMPQVTTALLYPGQVLLEGTNLSEGRGTTIPFEVVGAPFIDPQALAAALENQQHTGVAFRPIRFVPTFDKFQGQRCGGVAIHILDAAALRSVALTVGILAAVASLWPREFAWLPPPYEYEREKMPIDILFGSPRLREAMSAAASAGDVTIKQLAALDEAAWWRRVQPHLLYA